MKKIKGLILDMDGVIWRNKEPIGDLPSIFARISELDLKFLFATNNSTRTSAEYTEILQALGVEVNPNQILTSGSITADYLSGMHPEGGSIFIIGMPGLVETLKLAGFNHSVEDPKAVVVGLDTEFNYQKLSFASALINSGTPFIGTNPDVALPTPSGLVPGTGSLLAAISATTGVAPEIIGKPKKSIYKSAQAALDLPREEILAVGDRLETDILGAQNAGFQTALVLSGVSTLEDTRTWQPEINYICNNLETLIEEIA